MTIAQSRQMKTSLFVLLAVLVSSALSGYQVDGSHSGEPVIVIDGNLSLGMSLKKAIALLGIPERIRITKRRTILIPYDHLGTDLEVESDGKIVRGIHLNSAFKGRFASGLRIGGEFQTIINIYGQPDAMSKNRIEFEEIARIFDTREGKLVGASLYMPGWPASQRKATGPSAGKSGVFARFGVQVEAATGGVLITAVQEGSIAEYGGLKAGDLIIKIHEYRGLAGQGPEFAIQSISGLEQVLSNAIQAGWKEAWVIVRRKGQLLNSVGRLVIPPRSE